MDSHKVSRRDFLRSASVSAALLLGSAGAPGWRFPLLRAAAASQRSDRAAVGAAARRASSFLPDAEIALTAAEKWVQILPGAKTRVWSYDGQLVGGSGVTVQNIPGSYL